MATTFQDTKVTIHISDVDGEEKYPDRIITLQYPDWSINVGRGNSTEEALMPSDTNTWFTSRVVSRHHATFKAHPKDRLLTISDAGSMHGTYLNGDKVMLGRPEQLLQGDIITFGNQVIRGHDAFPPLKVTIHFDWSEPNELLKYKPFSNSFTADYSEEDLYSDVSNNEIAVVEDSVKQSRVEVIELDEEDQASVFNSPNTSSEQQHLSSESDLTSASVIELEDDGEKNYLFEKYGISQYGRSSSVASHESEDYDSSVDEIVDDYAKLRDLNAEDTKKTLGGTLNKTATAARPPSPSDAALAKPRPASPITTSSLVPPHFPPPPPPPPPAAKLPNLLAPLDAMRSNIFTETYPWRHASHQQPAPAAWESYMANSYAEPFGYNVSYEPYIYSYPHPVNSITAPPAPQTSLLKAAGLTSPSMPWHSTQYASHPVNNETGSDTCGTKRKADEISDCSEEDQSEVEHMVTGTNSPEDIPSNLSSQSPVTTSETALATHPDSAIVSVLKTRPTANMSAPATDIRPENAATDDIIERTLAVGVAEPAVEATLELPVHEPPRKKVKMETNTNVHAASHVSSTAGQVMKYAATAFAGATVGAIGTILGLAALPPDFFT